jgi:murE/murF fusion protein
MNTHVTIQGLIDQLRANVPEHAQWRLDSRAVRPGDVFIAIPGQHLDGRDFIQAAFELGASCVLQHVAATDLSTTGISTTGISTTDVYATGISAIDINATDVNATDISVKNVNLTEPLKANTLFNKDSSTQSIQYQQEHNVWLVEDLIMHLGQMAHVWYGKPSEQLTVIALTGTNGKTSCTQWLAQALRQIGCQAGAVGTLGITSLTGEQQSGSLTTPDVVSLHHQLATFASQGAQYVVMEASSIGLDQGRLNGVNIQWAGFLNLTHDHLDYHGTMEHYANAKARLFKHNGLRGAAINQDDSFAHVMVSACQVAVVLFGTQPTCGVQAKNIIYNAEGVGFELSINDQVALLQLPFYGAHNVSNLLCVASMLSLLGFDLQQIISALQTLKPVPGRMESVLLPFAATALQPVVLVDYAHTPDALAHVLKTSRAIAQQRQSRLWCVLGCGGDRDKAKRPMMGHIASLQADHVIITSDNPRNESPDSIIEQMMSGVRVYADQASSPVSTIADRALAILRCILDAEPADVIVIAGKGHETGQEVNGVTHPFDDRQWAAAGLLLRRAPVFETDSRAFTPEAVFVAIKGEKFDGHAYLPQLMQAGALAAIVNKVDHDVALPQIALGDTRQALTKMATAWRQCFDIPVIGVTGSNGKTTTKEMIAAILAVVWGDDARLATKGNLNNDLGVPLTVLRLRSTHRAAVIELGMNHPGEIASIAHCAQPTIGLVLNAQREHQEFMQTVQAVAQENGSVFQHLSGSGVAIFPATDQYAELWKSMSGEHQVVTFGLADEGHQTGFLHSTTSAKSTASTASFSISDIKSNQSGGQTFELSTPVGQVSIHLMLPGLHNILNAAAACACAWSTGVSLQAMAQALEKFGAVKGRMQVHVLASNQTLIDDTYNANPDSVRAAIDVLVSMPAPRLLVLGDMGEVGQDTAALHAEVGHYAKHAGVDQLLALGRDTRHAVQAFGAQAQCFETPEEVCTEILKLTPHSILVKGSRFMKMERVVNQFMHMQQQGLTQEKTNKLGVQHAV